MLHGLLLGSMATWYFAAAPRLARTHRILLFDLRGHGKSARPPSGYDLATMTADLRALLADFTDEPATLVGHSWGALMALRLAIAEPARVRRLALVEAPLPPSAQVDLGAFVRNAPAEILGMLPDVLRADAARGGRASANLIARLRALAQDTTILRDLAEEQDISNEELAAVACPTLLVYGDRSACRTSGVRLAAVIRGASLVVMPGGHYLPNESAGALTEQLAGWCNG
jgi:pimeloyl-ACP methyl ester carboxylesterase